MNHKKLSGRLAARRKSWDESKFPEGYKRPGSFKKPYPHGRNKSHK